MYRYGEVLEFLHIILVSAIQNVPIDYYEAAELDGASKIRQFFSITLPDIMPAVWFLLMTRIIGSLQVFDIIYTLTNGGPNKSTNTLVLYVYTQAFTKNNNMGYATAIQRYCLSCFNCNCDSTMCYETDK